MKLGDDFDVGIDAKELVGVTPKAGTDSGHCIALIDGKGDDGLEAWILTQEGDVRSVKRGDDRQMVSTGLEDAFGRGMRSKHAEWHSGHGVCPVSAAWPLPPF